MSSVPLMALRNSERRSDEAHDSDQISDEEDEPLESVLANMKYRYGNRNLFIYFILFHFHISHLGTYDGNGKRHIQYTSSDNLHVV